MKIDVLDHGFVELLDFMGNDKAIADAARNSYGEGTRTVSDDRKLIRHLMRHHHTSPFEMVEFKFHMRLPIFVARQMIRQRTANLNEYSGRYSVMKNLFYVPDPSRVGVQSSENNQGTGEAIDENEAKRFVQHVKMSSEDAFNEYDVWVNPSVAGNEIARELARITLPQNIYTEWTWKLDLHNLFNFLRQRLDSHAQWEIRQYAEAVARFIQAVCPVAYEAFVDYQLEAVTFSRVERMALGWWAGGMMIDQIEHEMRVRGATPREVKEFFAKIG